MAWFAYSEQRRVALAPGLTLTAGRDSTADLVVVGSRVSRHHLSFLVEDDGSLTVCDTSSNGSYIIGGLFNDGPVVDGTLVVLGAVDGPVVILTQDPAFQIAPAIATFRYELSRSTVTGETAVQSSGSSPSLIRLDGVVRFGRAADNDVVLAGLLASPHHAHVIASPDGLQVIDLATSRGTFVNGERVKTALLSIGDRVSMGGSSFIVTTDGLVPLAESGGVELIADRVRVTVDTTTLLHDISFTLPPRTVTAVVGPSGSGKSTLLGAMTGTRPATSGRVIVAGSELYSHYDELRYEIGLVPQQDLVPAQLKVREALEYAARLRFPKDTTSAERATRVDEVLHDLGLTQRAELRIDRLSGGQRKRVSVALEMLTKPSVLFLDEPTSGLDPGLDRQVMILLRELADSGRTVVVVTHAVENIGLADRLIVLAAGGYVAYDGPPADAPAYFNAKDMPGVFLALESVPAEEWARRREAALGTGAQTRPGTSGAPATRLVSSKPSGSFSQFVTLVSRTIRVIVSDRAYAGLLLVLPLVLAVTGFLVGNEEGLGFKARLGAQLLLLILVLGAVFTGAATSVQELVKDRVIYQRERAVGLSRTAYIGSKALVLGVIAAAQGFVFAMLALIGRPGPNASLVTEGHLEIALMVAAAAVAACMLGLLLSALLPTREAALPVLVIVTMIQVVFSGAVPLRFDWLLDWVGPFMAAYWAYKAMASSIQLDVILGPQADHVWEHAASEYWRSVGVLGLMSLVFIVATIILTGRHDPGKR